MNDKAKLSLNVQARQNSISNAVSRSDQAEFDFKSGKPRDEASEFNFVTQEN